MKLTQKLLSALLAVLLLMSLAITVFADGTASITINNASSEDEFTAYPIFTGTVTVNEDEERELADLEWSSAISPEGRLAICREVFNFEPSAYTSNSLQLMLEAIAAKVRENPTHDYARDIARVLTQVRRDAAGNILTPYIADGSGFTGTYNESTKKYTISNLQPGYYLIDNNKWMWGGGSINEARSLHMVYLAGNTTVNQKQSIPTVTKNIVQGSERVKVNNAGVGKIVDYELVGTLPEDFDEYLSYYYEFCDTLSPGLTYIEGSESVWIQNGSTVTEVKNGFLKPFDTTSTYSKENGTSLNFKFYNMKASPSMTTTPDDVVASRELPSVHAAPNPNIAQELKEAYEAAQKYKIELNSDSKIIVRYSATVNENAVILREGNPNTVFLAYQNDPYYVYNNDLLPGRWGVTPEQKVVTYVTELNILKYHMENGEPAPLPGAAFKLECTNAWNSRYSGAAWFSEDQEGEYYKLKTGIYTKVAPSEPVIEDGEVVNPGTASNYEPKPEGSDSYTRYSLNPFIEKTVGEDGTLTFTGLGAGSYRIVETVTPPGYNSIEEPIEFDVFFGAKNNQDVTSGYWFATNDGNLVHVGAPEKDENPNALYAEIENNKGATLPETGGIGTTLFYAIGGVLAVGAGILLISKKRMADLA